MTYAYENTDGVLSLFDISQARRSFEINRLLEKMYSFFQQYIPDCHVIMQPGDILACETNKWGLAPMHYRAQDYVRVFEKIRLYVSKSATQISDI